MLQGSGLGIAAVFALAEGIRRAGGHATALGRGHGAERALAVGQVILSMALLLALALMALVT